VSPGSTERASAQAVICDPRYSDSCSIGPAGFNYYAQGTPSTQRVLVLKALNATTPGRTSLWYCQVLGDTITPWQRLSQSLEFGVGPTQTAISAPALDRTVSTTTTAQLQFLYTGSSPIQVGVAPGTIDPTQAAGLSGLVLDRDSGNPVAGVSVSVVAQPAYGTTVTRADGPPNPEEYYGPGTCGGSSPPSPRSDGQGAPD
jgi:hypothetical protein